MDPRVYVPLYLERCYLEEHSGLTEAARELVHDDVRRNPERYAASERAQSLLAYARVHGNLMHALDRMEDLPDEEFEQERERLFQRARHDLRAIERRDAQNVDAQLLDILLADVPLDAYLADLLRLEQDARSRLRRSIPGFAPHDPAATHASESAPGSADAPAGIWDAAALGDRDPVEATQTEPEVIGWLHTLEALAQACMETARYRAAASYARQVMAAEGYPNLAVGTLLLALARLEDEDAFFRAAREADADTAGLPWFLLGRTLLLYKLGRERSARRALRDFANRCDGGAFFLLNPTYLTPYLPVRPEAREPWELSHQAVWEADGIIVDTPDFASWAAGVDGIETISEDFALRNGF